MNRPALDLRVPASVADSLSRPTVRPMLRFLTCGSVDDGKSTLIGRLLADAAAVPDDQLASLARDSARHGTAGGDLDYALLVDGLEAEREQGITIDVAWRSFTTVRRRFLIADTPGHEQYTRNMATGASTCDLAVMLVDARHGIRPQTLRHAQIAALLGVRHVVLAVNKMDLVGYARTRFAMVASDFAQATARHVFASARAIPIVARDGDNLARPSARMAWHLGPSLLEHLEGIDVGGAAATAPFRMAVQRVTRDTEGRRLYAGTVAAGRARTGDRVTIFASGAGDIPASGGSAVVSGIALLRADGTEARQDADAGEAVTLRLDRELDISRGDVLADPRAPLDVAHGFAAHVVWLADPPLIAGRPYLVKAGTRTVGATVSRVCCRLDVATGQRLTAETLRANEVGVVHVALNGSLAFEPYARNRALGGFIVIDRQSNATVGVGMIDGALRGADIVWHAPSVDCKARAALMGQVPAVVWLTGLSGAGKSTIANLVERQLHARGRHTYVLDGDNVRHGLSRDLGFTEADRVENIRRAAEVARLMADAGLIVLVSFISPYRTDRDMARERMGGIVFLEAHVDASVDECARRDTKGLYVRARAGEIANFTGVSAPYEPPKHPELHLPTAETTPEAMAARVVEALQARGCVPPAGTRHQPAKAP